MIFRTDDDFVRFESENQLSFNAMRKCHKNNISVKNTKDLFRIDLLVIIYQNKKINKQVWKIGKIT